MQQKQHRSVYSVPGTLLLCLFSLVSCIGMLILVVYATQANAAAENRFTAYLTAYTYYDNTPPGSSAISHPIIHQRAGGTGTYADPITLAVGHSITSGRQTLDFPAGTRFYVPNVRRYFIVEDVCGDSSTPQNGPCHTGYPSGTSAWLDMWIDGQGGSVSSTEVCMNRVTGAFSVIQNPADNYVVVPGAVASGGGCTQTFGNTAVTTDGSTSGTPTNTSGACTHGYATGSTPPSGYGASYNLFSTANELLVQGSNCTTNSFTLKVGSGGNQYVYKQGYTWNGTTWEAFTLTGGALQDNLWYLGTASKSFTNQTTVSNGIYVVGYVCQQVDGVWKCGCRNNTCSTPLWQLQQITR